MHCSCARTRPHQDRISYNEVMKSHGRLPQQLQGTTATTWRLGTSLCRSGAECFAHRQGRSRSFFDEMFFFR